MIDDLPNLKAATIERCVSRARGRGPDTFAPDLAHQDAAILSIVHTCDAALDMGQHLIYRERLGILQNARDVFTPLAQGSWINNTLAESLKSKVDFREIALYDGQTLQLPVTVTIIEKHLDQLQDCSERM